MVATSTTVTKAAIGLTLTWFLDSHVLPTPPPDVALQKSYVAADRYKQAPGVVMSCNDPELPGHFE